MTPDPIYSFDHDGSFANRYANRFLAFVGILCVVAIGAVAALIFIPL